MSVVYREMEQRIADAVCWHRLQPEPRMSLERLADTFDVPYDHLVHRAAGEPNSSIREYYPDDQLSRRQYSALDEYIDDLARMEKEVIQSTVVNGAVGQKWGVTPPPPYAQLAELSASNELPASTQFAPSFRRTGNFVIHPWMFPGPTCPPFWDFTHPESPGTSDEQYRRSVINALAVSPPGSTRERRDSARIARALPDVEYQRDVRSVSPDAQRQNDIEVRESHARSLLREKEVTEKINASRALAQAEAHAMNARMMVVHRIVKPARQQPYVPHPRLAKYFMSVMDDLVETRGSTST